MMLGFALAAVGLDTVTGTLRMTYGVTDLLQGFDFLIAVIGLFGLGEILLTMEEGLAFKGKSGKIDPDDRVEDVEDAAAATGRRRCAPAWSAAGWASRRAARRPRRS